jgi:hypothetical protein
MRDMVDDSHWWPKATSKVRGTIIWLPVLRPTDNELFEWPVVGPTLSIALFSSGSPDIREGTSDQQLLDDNLSLTLASRKIPPDELRQNLAFAS